MSHPLGTVGAMSVAEATPAPPLAAAGPSPQEAAWRFAEGEAVAVMGAVNVAVARLVAAVRGLLDTDGWEGVGIRSPEHWLCWKANLSRARAEGLVTIARRARDLPECWAAFAAGRLGEDAMVRIARRVPAARDAEVAALAPTLLVAQLDRLFARPARTTRRHRPAPARSRSGCCACATAATAGYAGEFCLPADEGALVRLGLTAGRDAEFRDRNDLPDPDRRRRRRPRRGGGGPRRCTWADGLVRMASEAADAFDPTYRRTGHRGERNTVVFHVDLDPDGTLGPAQFETGPVVPDPVARYLACDAQVQVMAYRLGQLIGIHPTQRTPNRAMRRYLARHDQGCTHPLCTQTAVAPRPPHRLLGTRRPHRTPRTSCSSAPNTTGPCTTASSPSSATPRRAQCASSTTGTKPSPRPTPTHPRTRQADPTDGPPPPYTPPLAERLTAHTFTWN